MLNTFSQFITDLLRGKRPDTPDPDGTALARLLFAQPDPLDLSLPALLGGIGSLQRISGLIDPVERREANRAQVRASSELVFVAAPASMRKLREAGFIQKNTAGAEIAVFEGHQIPFGGYADDVSFDDKHWGLEMRRFGPERQVELMTRALRNSEADQYDNDHPGPRGNSSPSASKKRL